MNKLQFILVAAIAGSSILFAQQASASISTWQKGASMVPKSTTDLGSANFQQSLQNLKSTGANSVSFILPYYQSSQTSSDIQSGYNTPTDASLASAIDYAHSLGMQVMLKPHLECYCGQWRAYINASDRTTWFANYSAMLNHIGGIAQAHNAEEIAIGTELITMASGDINPDNTTQWRTMITSLRGVYSGKLTYSANWGASGFNLETTQIKFWDALDQIGISAYYNLSSSTNAVSDIASQWDNWNNNYIKPLNTTYGKPIVFTEIGYKSAAGARFEPWAYWNSNGYDGTEQANLYAALFSYWNNFSYMQGVQLWFWDTDPNAGWPGNTDYMPQHKPAQDVMTQYFGSSTPTPPPPTTGPLTFTTSAQASPNQVTPGQSFTETANVKNTSTSAASNILVDVENYDSSGNKVNQQVYDNQTIAAGQTQTYNFAWSTTVAGNYTIKIGIFSSGWGTTYDWNGSAGSFTVASSSPPPPPPPSGSLSFTTSVQVSPASIGANQQLTEAATVKNTSSVAASNILIDVETYNSSGSKVNQQTFVGQSFTAGQNQAYKVTWSTPNLGNYTVKVGVFSSGWGTNYYWNDSAATFSVAASSPPPPPPPSTTPGPLDIWWPTNGSTVQGVQPFKAMVENLDVANYNMYWQVDGGALNLMSNSSTDYPHKEALVDTTNWTWSGNGPYSLNFLAKNLSNNPIIQKGISIMVAH